MEQTECSETSAYKIQTPGNYPEENIQHTEHGESLKSRIVICCSGNVKRKRMVFCIIRLVLCVKTMSLNVNTMSRNVNTVSM
jgi:hypothetical protein